MSVFRLIYCILFPYYPQNLNIPKTFQIIIPFTIYMESNIYFHKSAVTPSLFQYLIKNFSASMQEHYGPL